MIFPLTRLNEFFKENLPFKGIISIYGDFGVGKTTFSLQILINTVLLDEDAIFIYTKSNIPITKLNMLINEKNSIDIKDIIDKISMIKISNFEDLRKLSFIIEFFILENQNKIIEQTISITREKRFIINPYYYNYVHMCLNNLEEINGGIFI